LLKIILFSKRKLYPKAGLESTPSKVVPKTNPTTPQMQNLQLNQVLLSKYLTKPNYNNKNLSELSCSKTANEAESRPPRRITASFSVSSPFAKGLDFVRAT